MRVRSTWIVGGISLWCGASVLAAAPGIPKRAPASPPSSEAVEFFEKEIRPLLATECYSCHGPKVQQGGLRLDSREAFLKGGSRGASLNPAHPEQSLLLKAVRHDELRMPPGKKLPDSQIAALEKWLRLRAPWPTPASQVGTSTGPKVGDLRTFGPSNLRTPSKHWSFQPLKRPTLPRVKNTGWVKTPLDTFVLARLEKEGLSPSPPADRRTLLRRVYFDLIGLPPTPEEVDAFLANRAPDAYEKVVDRLLASPRYGERWGRHWMDVARYADTKDGVLMFGPNRIRPFAYTYRDYVIRALNEDTPYDRFVHEQLAADQIQPPVEPWRLAGMGYLTLGKMFDNNVHDVIDDRIDVVTRGFMGLTVACARCHDHKYDPIPTADYYSLYGVFASSEAPLELPLIEKPETIAGSAEFEKAYTAKRQEIQKFLADQFTQQSEAARTRVADYLMRTLEKPDPLETAIFFLSLSPEDLRPQIVARWRKYLERRARPEDPVFGPWHDLMQLPDDQFAAGASAVLARWKAQPAGTGPRQLNPLVREALAAASLTDKPTLAKTYGALFLRAYTASRQPGAAPGDAAHRQLVEVLTAQDSPAFFPLGQTWHYMSRGEKDRYGGMQVELDRLAVTSQNVPARAMVLNDAPELLDPRIFVRGNPSVPGDRVPRQFLSIVSGKARRPFTHGSGRLDLARAITAPGNPLTARVMVNRVWMHHFGEPLVTTPGDFGTRSTPPSHPELLDYLASLFSSTGTANIAEGVRGQGSGVGVGTSLTAATSGTGGSNSPQNWGARGAVRGSGSSFILHPSSFTPKPPPPPIHTPTQGLGWSLKALHKLIVTSSAYQQASFDRPAARKRDPENRLLWRYNRRRLDLESMRDGMLTVAGRLDTSMGGRPVDVAGDPLNKRRTVYSLVDRQGLPGLFRNFDFANPDQSADRRPLTTVPQQALFGLNAPFVLEQAKALAARPEVAGVTTPEQQVAALYRLALLRAPQPGELSTALRFLREAESPAAEKSQLTPLQQLAQVLLLTNEFQFVD